MPESQSVVSFRDTSAEAHAGLMQIDDFQGATSSFWQAEQPSLDTGPTGGVCPKPISQHMVVCNNAMKCALAAMGTLVQPAAKVQSPC